MTAATKAVQQQRFDQTWIGVLRPPIVRITIGRPQAQFADVHTMVHLLSLTPLTRLLGKTLTAAISKIRMGNRYALLHWRVARSVYEPDGLWLRAMSQGTNLGVVRPRHTVPSWHRSSGSRHRPELSSKRQGDCDVQQGDAHFRLCAVPEDLILAPT